MQKSLIAASMVAQALLANVLVLTDEPTPLLSDCDVGCAECVKGYMTDAPSVMVNACANWTVYRYAN